MIFLETPTGGKAVAHQNYLFKLKSSKQNYSWWACKLNTCNSKLTIKDSNLVIAEKGTHAHADNQHEIKALQCLQQIKKRTLEDVMTPIPTIYR